MPPDPLTIEAEVQQVLYDLWSEKLIPFALNVGKVTKDPAEYIIHFHDSRMRTVYVPLIKDHSFKDLVRFAVLARVAKISGPLSSWNKQGLD